MHFYKKKSFVSSIQTFKKYLILSVIHANKVFIFRVGTCFYIRDKLTESRHALSLKPLIFGNKISIHFRMARHMICMGSQNIHRK